MFYFNFIKNKDLLIGLFSISSFLELNDGAYIWDSRINDTVVLSWRKGNTVNGIRFVIDTDTSIAIGTLVRWIPYIRKDLTGEKVFTVNMQGNNYETHYFEYDLFLNSKLKNIDISSALNFRGGSLFEVLDISLPLINQDFLLWGVCACYYRFLNIARVGVYVERFMPVHFLGIEGSFFYDLNRDIYGSSAAYCVLKGSIFLAKDEKVNPYMATRDFYWRFSAAVSYDREIFTEGSWGTLFELAAENIKVEASGKTGYFRLVFGVSKSYHDSYYRLPVIGETLINFVLQTVMDNWD